MNNGLDVSLKSAQLSIDVLFKFFSVELNTLDILLKERDPLANNVAEKIEKMKATVDILKDHMSADGNIFVFRCSPSDKKLVEDVLKANEKAFIDKQNGDDKEFVGKFNNKHFSFEEFHILNPDNSYDMFVKNTDFGKFCDLISYLNENNMPNNIKLYHKNIKNILEYDDNKQLVYMDLLPLKESSTFCIANMLNNNGVPFELSVDEHGVSLLFDKENEGKVDTLIHHCSELDITEQYYCIKMAKRDFNNRQEAKEAVDKLIKESPKMPDIKLKVQQETEDKGRE